MKKYKTISAKKMQEIDALAQGKFNIHGDVLMENAGRAVAEEILNNYFSDLCDTNRPTSSCPPSEELKHKQVIIFCGSGNNGGDGLVIARYLLQWGLSVKCFLVDSENYTPLVVKNLKRAFFISLSVKQVSECPKIPKSFLIVDALLGTGSKGSPRGVYKDIIEQINKEKSNVLSVDIPSGLDADSGKPNSPCIKANLTLTLGLVKDGLLKKDAENFVGEIKRLNIGLPEELLKSYLI
ncbi:MAG: NAD(P)H-hydrate epimerase [Elusimicrobiaceae bacterium]|jgi:ADP-dependent NAD(P)H-hydrate dehydratase / NAD(P)H-hydrate epimerase|nr:NAD(P)H-hydrate epimerase [Elusimicrobiaceae bacterium]MBT3955620.1 NAD(P)H-hydrate epimerase [Elusimicrobiaceae bacterium]MBT4008734.1 NAD(P)H-hydrate epimerase [Elusimicrobiaceae bacterium]MBT4402775.1 NAD(P)H-hydrate epimerase [Elusimicrobiaceae bacterium]MBT4439590.1 NAD(P)H-hydrate epimerase [Elusimicrobiaceae bacterium]